MPARSDAETEDLILAVVVELLEREGHEAVQLRRVARTSHLSFATIYRFFPNRDALILAAVQRWMAGNSWAPLPVPGPDTTLHDAVMEVLGCVFEPWERNPNLLKAFHRALVAPGGERLEAQCLEVILPLLKAVPAGPENQYLSDVEGVLTNLTFAYIAKVANGTMDVSEVLPTLGRAVDLLTGDNQAQAERAMRSALASPPITNPQLL